MLYGPYCAIAGIDHLFNLMRSIIRQRSIVHADSDI